MNIDPDPEIQAAIEDQEVQDAENEAFLQGWNDPRHTEKE